MSDVQKEMEQSDGFKGEGPQMVSSSSSLATFACAWLQETMQPSAAPQEMWNTDIKQKVNLTAPTGDGA